MNNLLRWAVVWLSLCFVLPAFAQQPIVLSNGGFDKSGRSTNLSVTTTTSSTALPTTAGQTLLVMNLGTTNTVFVQLGNSTVTATTALGLPVFPNSSITIPVGGNTHIAAITSSSTSTVATLRGSGVPAMAGGGSAGGGGGGGAVTIADGADVAEGTTTDAACAGDGTSGCTALSRISRIAARLTTLITNLGTSNGNGQATPANSSPVVQAGLAYETVAASATAQVLGGSGATGDFLSHCVIYPATTSPGVVTVFDNASAAGTNVIAFAGGASSVSNLAPIAIPVGAFSVAGPWKVTTGTNAIVACYGKFS